MIFKLPLKCFNSFFAGLGCVLLCSGCGYRPTGTSNALSRYQSIEVPYVSGDQEGKLTSALVHKLANAGVWAYSSSNGDLSLNVSIVGIKHEDVGFNRFEDENRQIKRWLVPNERRLSILVRVSVVDEGTQKTILGPQELSTSVRFDFNPEIDVSNLVSFSLGQYDFVENAQENAHEPLYEQISDQIVAYLLNSW